MSIMHIRTLYVPQWVTRAATGVRHLRISQGLAAAAVAAQTLNEKQLDNALKEIDEDGSGEVWRGSAKRP